MSHVDLAKCGFLDIVEIQITKSGISAKEGSAKHTHIEPHSLQTGWHCIHQATLGLNKGSCCRLPTGYPTQWNPELQVSLWRASWRQRNSFCDAFPSKLTGSERMGSSAIGQKLQCLYRPVGVCVCVWVFSLTYSQDKVIVWLIVDGIQHIKHLDGKIWHCA